MSRTSRGSRNLGDPARQQTQAAPAGAGKSATQGAEDSISWRPHTAHGVTAVKTRTWEEPTMMARRAGLALVATMPAATLLRAGPALDRLPCATPPCI